VPRADCPIAALLCVDGVVLPPLGDAAVQAAVSLLAGLPALLDGGGDRCPCCGDEVGVQHHHTCSATTQVARGAVHRAVQAHIVALFERAGVSATAEVWIEDDGLRIDLRLDGYLDVEVKTLAMHAPSRAHTTLAALELELRVSVAEKYGPDMRVLAVSRDGRVTPHGLAVMGEMQRLLDGGADADGAPRPTVAAAIGAAVVEAEAAVVACWRERVAEKRAAAAGARACVATTA